MRRNIFSCLLLVSLTADAQIPLAESKWKGHFTSPRPMDVRFTFSTDSLIVSTEPGVILGGLLFSQHHDSLLVKKVYGKSSCAEEMEGLYRIEWLENGEKFLLHTIHDGCAERAGSFSTHSPFERIKGSNDISRNWSYKSRKDSIPGIGLYETYELLKGRKSEPVIVAVISGGIDMNHEDLKGIFWRNTKEIPGNDRLYWK